MFLFNCQFYQTKLVPRWLSVSLKDSTQTAGTHRLSLVERREHRPIKKSLIYWFFHLWDTDFDKIFILFPGEAEQDQRVADVANSGLLFELEDH